MSDEARSQLGSQVDRLIAGRYRLESALAGGGTAAVYRARDLQTGAAVAIKELRPQFARLPSVCRRFLREAELASRLAHPGIVRVLGHGEAGAAGPDTHGPFLVLELLEGETLRQLLERLGPLGSLGARRIVGTLAVILDHAHQQGVIHRDLKPENVFLVGPPYPDLPSLADDPALPDRIRLADFGQARVAALASLTGVSATWGTPEYMAPEVFARARLDPRSDLYSLGVMLHELTTGRLPWSRTSALQRLGPGARTAGPPPATGAEVGIDGLIAALLSPRPEERPESGAEVVRRLAPGGLMLARAPVRVGCPGCGAALDSELPVCLQCGQERMRLAHAPSGRWRLTLRTLQDDAATVGRLLDLMAQIAEDDSRPLLFLTGDPHLYSKEERAQAIRLPAVLFRDLDEGTARTLERLFREQGLDVEASDRRTGWRVNPLWFNPRTLTMSGLVTVTGTMMVTRVSDSISAAAAVIGAGWAVALGVLGMHEGDRQTTTPALRRLRGEWLAVPAADRLLAQAGSLLGRMRQPEARALLAELVGSLYRLALRAGRLTASPGTPPVSPWTASLAESALASMPGLTDRLGLLADRLQRLDDELAGSSEAELLQELGRLERRLARAAPGDSDRLHDSRRQLERSLARRHELETERDELTAAVCQLLGRLRTAARQAERLTASDGTETAELASSLAEVDRLLALPPATSELNEPSAPSGTPDGRPSPAPAGS